MEIGKIIKEKRIAKDLTQEELANEFFVSRQLISKWENGKSYPDLNQLIKLSDYFELSLDELMRGDRKMTKKLNIRIKKNQFFLIMIVLLVISIGLIGYVYWENRTVQLKPADIEIISIKASEDEGSNKLNTDTGKKITLPSDVSYTVKFKIKKAFVGLSTGYYFDSDKDNLYIDMRGQNSLFNRSDKKEYSFTILSDTKKYTENENMTVDKNYSQTIIKDKDIRILDFSKPVHPVDANLMKLNSWLFIDKSEIKY